MLSYQVVFPQTVSLTVNCETEGSLSSLITSSEQETVVNLTVTGFINKTDLTFIKKLIRDYSLHGAIDLGNTTLNVTDNMMPAGCLSTSKSIKKFVFPKSIESVASSGCFGETNVDTIVWTNTEIDNLYISNNFPKSFFVLPEGLFSIQLSKDNFELVLPSTITRIVGYGSNSNLTVYSMIENPQAIYARYQYSTSTGYRDCAAFQNSTFYIPKGSMAKYLRSELSTMQVYYWNGNTWTYKPSNNTFIEYYDVDSTICNNSIMIYKEAIDSIQAQIYPDANLVSGINYTSSNPEIVSVDQNGIITGVNYGEAIITVTPHVFIDGLETKSATCNVKVITHPEGITMDSTLYVHLGEVKQLIARTLPLDITDDRIIYSCSDTTIATVSDEGLVKGISRGSCVITATSVDGGFNAQCLVSVLLPVEAVIMEMHNFTLNVNQSESLYAHALPLNADNKRIIWSSTDNEIAEVDADGTVTALKPGIAFIKATSEDNPLAVDSCKVTVTQPVNGITLNYSQYGFNQIGATAQLIATITPDDASNKEVQWHSSNESICFISNGTIVSTGYGTCVVIATTVDGGHLASCIVDVYKLGDVNRDSVINIGDITTIIDMLLDGTGSEYDSIWADVNADGVVSIKDVTDLIDQLLNSSN